MLVCPECKAVGPARSDWGCSQCSWTPRLLDGITCFSETPQNYDGYDPAFFAKLASLEDRHFWFIHRARLIAWALARFLPRRSSLLEIGCGTGHVLRSLGRTFPDMALHGSELFPEGLRFAHERTPQAHLFQMDARAIPFRDQFDVVGAFDVLEHIDEDDLVLGQMRAAVGNRGSVLITVPQHPSLWGHMDEHGGHKRRYTREELTRKLRLAGFEPLLVMSFISLLFPLLYLSRFSRRGSTDVFSELTIGPGANALCRTATILEERLLRVGLRFPFGGSLLVAARAVGASR